MDNLNIYNKVRTVPKEALKTISAGRLKGMSDINPMWRIKVLTEMFGPVGFGWKYEIVKEWMTPCENNNTVAAFVDINLYYKYNDEWSEAIPGTGGSMFVASEKSGLHVSDECFKMALTDAISVACKAMGIGADVYWDKDTTKYSNKDFESEKVTAEEALAMKVGFGEYSDMLLTDVYKKSAKLLESIYHSPEATQRVKEAINILINMAKKK